MKLIEILKEIGETTAKPYSLTKVDESVYYVTYEFEAKKEDEEDKEGNKKDDKEGIKYKIVIGKNFKNTADEGGEEEYDEYQMEFLVSFGVVSRGTVDFEAEYKDVKNLFRVMATVIKAVKISIEDEEDESGIPVTRIIMEPTKRDKGDTRRANLYMRFIEKQMPEGSRITTKDGGSVIVVDLPETLNEGWKENLLFVGAMALSSLGLKSVAQSAPRPDQVSKSTEVTDQRKETEREFYAAMVAAAKEMKAQGLEGNMSPEEFAALKEASKYFESLRDGKIPQKPSRLAQVAIDHLYRVVAKAPAAEIARLAGLGRNIKTQDF